MSAHKIPEDRDLIHDLPAIERAMVQMAKDIDAELAGERPIYMTVLTGGLMVAGCLAPKIKLPLEFDYVHATRYRGATEGGKLHWFAKPRCDLRNRTVLLVDDILDEGHTLEELRRFCFDAGARDVKIAVLCIKKHERRVPGLKADFCELEVPDRYVFGFGMDYRELGRNLPAIYALKQEK